MTRHPSWCVNHECTVLDDPELPVIDGEHHSQTFPIATEGLTAGAPLGPITAWLTQLPTPDLLPRPVGAPEVWLHLHSGQLGNLLVIPAITAARALKQLADLVALAEPDSADAPIDPRRPRPRLQLTWADQLQAERDAEERDRRLGGGAP